MKIRLSASQNIAITALLLAIIPPAQAGPPFFTDDPDPVELHQWEINFATLSFHSTHEWSGSAPLLEINYGVLDGLELHAQVAMNYSKLSGEPAHFGFSDTELGFEWRFLDQEKNGITMATYPTLELPTGNHAENLGGGKTQLFLPLWLQREFGKWTTYGGGGYWFNPGYDNRNFWFAGWELQRKITEHFTAGVEIYHQTGDEVDESSQTNMGLGVIWDLSETYHILAYAGHSVQGPAEFQSYVGLRITFGPDKEKKDEKGPMRLMSK
jgi:hypothetical protein